MHLLRVCLLLFQLSGLLMCEIYPHSHWHKRTDLLVKTMILFLHVIDHLLWVCLFFLQLSDLLMMCAWGRDILTLTLQVPHADMKELTCWWRPWFTSSMLLIICCECAFSSSCLTCWCVKKRLYSHSHYFKHELTDLLVKITIFFLHLPVSLVGCLLLTSELLDLLTELLIIPSI